MPLPTRLSAELYASASGPQQAPVPAATIPRRAVDVSVLAGRGAAQSDVLELRAQVAFLEDVVKRQAAELAKNIASAASGVEWPQDPALQQFIQARARTARACSWRRLSKARTIDAAGLDALVWPGPHLTQGLLQPGAPTPPWLTDQKLLSPLLAAYDMQLEIQVRLPSSCQTECFWRERLNERVRGAPKAPARAPQQR